MPPPSAAQPMTILQDGRVEASRSYLPGVDGLRAIAVLAVITFHFHPVRSDLFGVGWTGVWLFFCISGFVITKSLLQEIDRSKSPAIVLLDFYARRALRILPLYLVIVFAGVLASLAFGQYKNLDHIPYLLTFTYDYYRMWPGYAHTELFGHLWSLSVEQQFYLFYPFLVLGLGRGRALVVALSIGMIVAISLRLLIGILFLHLYNSTEVAGNAVYQFAPGHFDSFAAGGLLAIAERGGRIGGARFPLLLAATAASTAIFFLISNSAAPNILQAAISTFRVNVFGPWQTVGVYALLVLYSSLAIAVAAGPRSPVQRILETPALAHVGKISYGMYIMHFPLIWIKDHLIKTAYPHMNSLALFIIILFTLTALSHLSFVYFERPVSRIGRRKSGALSPGKLQTN